MFDALILEAQQMAFAFNDNEDNEGFEVGDESENEVFSEAEALEWSGELLEAGSKQVMEHVLRNIMRQAKDRSGFDIAGETLTAIGRFFMSLARESVKSSKYSGDAIAKNMKKIRIDAPNAKSAEMEAEFGEVAPLMEFVQAVGTSVKAAGQAGSSQSEASRMAPPSVKPPPVSNVTSRTLKATRSQEPPSIANLKHGCWIRKRNGEIHLLPCLPHYR